MPIMKIFCEIADNKAFNKSIIKSFVNGFTTNPNLMRKT
jgi:Transaldolase